MPKWVHESNIEEIVQSQVAAIRDLQDKLQNQFDDFRELKELYTLRNERLQKCYHMCFTFWLWLT
jgi:hypothetical protein